MWSGYLVHGGSLRRSDRARAGSINPEAQEAVQAIDKMLGLAGGTLGKPDEDPVASLPDGVAAAGVEVTVEEAFSFAQHMSAEGRKLLEKAQASPMGSIAPDALRTLSLIDNAIQTATAAEVSEFARTRVANHLDPGRSASVSGRAASVSAPRSGTVSHASRPARTVDGPGERRRVATSPAGPRPVVNLTVTDADAQPAETVVNPAADASSI